MFDSGISVKDLIEELKTTEVDIALEIPNATYVSWLNSLQQLLYSEIIKEQKKKTILAYMYVHSPPMSGGQSGNRKINPVSLSTPDMSGNYTSEGEDEIRFEDIFAVYHDGIQLIKSTLTSGEIFPDTYFKNGNLLGYNIKNETPTLTIMYYVRPAIIKPMENDEIPDSNVMIPIEFIDLVKAKLRGEAYKLANEGELAAMWLNDYNILLETFKAWIAEKSPNFGM